MLVLTRRVGENIVIGGTIRVTVVAAGGNRVRLGIEAPPEVGIRRQELRAGPRPAGRNGRPGPAS